MQNQEQIAHQLATILRAVVAQQLLPTIDGGLVAAREVMITNRAIANLIRNSQIEQIYSVIETSQNEGMVTMNKAIDKLYEKGIISESVARNRKRDLETRAIYY